MKLLNGTDLKPCPFCGGEVSRVRGVYGLNFFKCRNMDCGAVMSFDNDYYNANKEKAIEQYNRRTNNETD